MREFSIEVEIAAAPERVWRVIADLERWPEWTPSVTRVERLDHGPLALGSRVRIHQPRLPPAVWQVSELQDGARFTWITRSPGVLVIAQHSVEPIARGSRARLSVRFEGLLGALVARLTRRLNERYLALDRSGGRGGERHRLSRACDA
jgi:uncharacterized protein YndB with AHSA1/START domain